MEILGFKRSDGRVGIRNHILILPTSSCSAETARIIAAQVDGAVTFQNQQGCGQLGRDLIRTNNILVSLGCHPNVFGVVVVGLGCETCQPGCISEEIGKRGMRVKKVVIQEEGGTLGAIQKGVRYASEMALEASAEQRISCSLADLTIALECGGSDPTSGLAANPSVGHASDKLIEAGGSTILSETTEFIGAEDTLASRMAKPELIEDLKRIIGRLEESARRSGEDLRGGNPTPGNIASGISTIEEKSLGCINKAGSSQLEEVLEYGEKPTRKGLLIMDSPGFDVDSVVGMVASGAQICIFTTGMGTPVGNGIVPVIKVTGNEATYHKMRDNIDVNAGEVLSGKKSIEESGEEIFQEICRVAQGKKTKAEIFGFSEFGIWRCGETV